MPQFHSNGKMMKVGVWLVSAQRREKQITHMNTEHKDNIGYYEWNDIRLLWMEWHRQTDIAFREVSSNSEDLD